LPSPSAEAIRSATQAVLARKEFQPQHDPLDFLRKLLSGLEGLGSGLPVWVGWLFLAAATGLVIYLLTRLLPGPSKAARKRDAQALVEVLEGAATTPEEALQRAREAWRQGDQRKALWIAHRLLLFALDAREAVSFAGHKTNGDYLAECPNHPLLHQLSGDYDRVIYAHREVDPQTVERYLQAVEEVL